MRIKQLLLLFLALTILGSCASKRKGDPGEFKGNYQVGETSAIVIPIHKAYEIELQTSAEPILFFFEEMNEDSLYKYFSDDESMYFLMQKGHKKGYFYEITEPPMEVIKED